MELPDIATPSELAECLKVPERTLARWRCLGTGPEFVRVGRHVRYLSEAVEAWLKGQERSRTA